MASNILRVSEEFPLSDQIRRVAEVICDIQHGHGVYEAYEFQRNTYNFVAGQAIQAFQQASGPADSEIDWDAISSKNGQIAELRASLKEMVAIYWGDGDGQEPPPACITRAQAAIAAS